jgi:hypothetical protein
VAATLIAAGVATVMAVADFPAIPIDRTAAAARAIFVMMRMRRSSRLYRERCF